MADYNPKDYKYEKNKDGVLMRINIKTKEAIPVSELVGDQNEGDVTAKACAMKGRRRKAGIDVIEEV